MESEESPAPSTSNALFSMPEHTISRRYRIMVMISVLLISLIILFGLFFRQFIYWQTSGLLLEESKRIFSRINHELSKDYQTTRKTISQTVHMLAATGLPEAASLDERVKYLSILQAALIQEPSLTGLQVGYSSGDYFIARSARVETIRHHFQVPAQTELIVDNISHLPGHPPEIERLFYDRNLQLLEREAVKRSDYDPRLRPWYIEAIGADTDIITAPYMFHFQRQMGTTVAVMNAAGNAVVAGDVTLDQLSATLATYQLTPRSELLLLEKKDGQFWVVAYQDPNQTVITIDGSPQRCRAIDLKSEVIRHAATLPDIFQPISQFTFNGEQWLGSTKPLEHQAGDDLYLVMLAPENELLLEAKKIREETLSYALIMTIIAIPLSYILARKISRPIQALAMETQRIGRFEFKTEARHPSSITEVDDLGRAMATMENTIGQFLSLVKSLAGEQNLDRALELVTQETMVASEAKAAMTFIVNDTNCELEPKTFCSSLEDQAGQAAFAELSAYNISEGCTLVQLLGKGSGTLLAADQLEEIDPVVTSLQLDTPHLFLQPLINRQGDSIGLLCLVYEAAATIEGDQQKGRRAFIEAISGFAAVTLEGRRMLKRQKDLLDAFIRILAGAIDSKSPYTGGHCQRVPVLTELLARKACEASDGPLSQFSLSEDQWEAIRIASWLHDCGKVTTPEYVVDKATKLETIYDRIHEIRMRYEVIKREVQVLRWQQIAEGGDREAALTALEDEWRQLDEEFAFVAECNLGGEFMDDDKISRLHAISGRNWMRTLDDRLGISWEELQRKERTPAPSLPVMEPLLADRDDHLYLRTAGDIVPPNNPYGFKLEVPEHLYNKGELYNLSIRRGTLTPEERYKINDHIVQSIVMLKQLPYPSHLKEVPDIAGGHHEKMDGTGYPRRLHARDMSIPSRIMVIADIFEALTASDRPYKKAKTISEAIHILSLMEKEHHIDPELFRLFLESGAYLEYAREYLLPEQIDEVDISAYLAVSE